MNAAFFDIFGLGAFIVLVVMSIWMFKTRKETPDWMVWIIFIIALIGFVVDSIMVIKTYLM
jgi:hypothetical protein